MYLGEDIEIVEIFGLFLIPKRVLCRGFGNVLPSSIFVKDFWSNTGLGEWCSQLWKQNIREASMG